MSRTSIPAVFVNGLSFQVGPSHAPRTLLDDISFVLPQAHFAAIIGSSGCGKSTLLRALGGMLTPSSGWLDWMNSAINGTGASPGDNAAAWRSRKR